jgi:hypothetical protein
MEPRIQYAKSADGVGIAFCTLGVRMPALLTPLGPPIPLECGRICTRSIGIRLKGW